MFDLNSIKLDRRSLIKAAGLAGAGYLISPAIANAQTTSTDNLYSLPFDVSRDLPVLTQNKESTLYFQFKADSGVNGNLVSATGTNSWTVKLVNGHFEIETIQNGSSISKRYPNATDRPTHYDDDAWHWLAIRRTDHGITVYLDGGALHSVADNTSPYTVAGLTRLILGSDSFSGTIRNWSVYPEAHSAQEISNNCPLPGALAAWDTGFSVAPTTSLINRVSALGALNALTKGSIFVEFQTTATGVVSLISVGDSNHDSTDFTIALNDGNLVFEHRVKGSKTYVFTVPAALNDNVKHSVCVTVSPFGSLFYVDGSEVERHSATKFISQLTDANGLWFGGNVDINGPQWQLTGYIHRAAVFDVALTAQQVYQLSQSPAIDIVALFDRDFADSANYRIPSLLRLQNGILIAAADQRTASAADSPNHIQTVIRRSIDDGKTWSNVTVAIAQPGSGRTGASTIDTCLVQDTRDNEVLVIVDRFPGGVGQANSLAGTGYSADGAKLLFGSDSTVYHLQEDGTVTLANGDSTDFFVATDGTVSYQGTVTGNIHLAAPDGATNHLREFQTSYLVVSSSTDDGVTWTDPVDITHQVKEPWMKFLGTGPGSAIQLKHGPHAGRILVPIYFNNASAPSGVYSSAVIYTDDKKTWYRSSSPNDGRVLSGISITAKTLTSRSGAMHEATIVEQQDGSITMFMRNPGNRVLRSISTDGGETWSSPSPMPQVPEIFSQPNAIAAVDPITGDQVTVFSNASRRYTGDAGRTNERGSGRLRLSENGGDSWQYNRTFRADNFVYSSMAQLPNGDIGILWEKEWDGIYFSIVPFAWLTQSSMQ